MDFLVPGSSRFLRTAWRRSEPTGSRALQRGDNLTSSIGRTESVQRSRYGPIFLLNRSDDAIRVGAGDDVPSGLYGFHPLRFRTKRDAGNSEEKRFLLHAARVSENGAGVLLKYQHVQVAHRGNHSDVVCDFPPIEALP